MESYRQTPIFKKSQEILDTVRAIVELFPEDNDHLQMLKNQLLEDAMLIQAKLAGASSVILYDLKMENATFIRKSARDLMVSYHSLKGFGFEEFEYFKIVREQIEEFRLLFIDWVSGFNPKHFIADNWGLFNPSGIGPDYEQRSDELNFLDEDD